MPDFVLQELLKRQEQVVNVNPDTLIVVNCQIAELEVDDLETIELSVSQTDDYTARLEFYPSLKRFLPSIVPFTDNDF
ncbi:MAG TPA: hypothetical protein VE956_07125 [Nodularia sp. (in: cyanobacteria)]|nr:hypothetical protein [Nodularia sp. (in: cyanobacteria)]